MAKSQLPFDSVTPKTKLSEDKLNGTNPLPEEETDTGEKEKAAEENKREEMEKERMRSRNDFTTGNITIKCEPEEESELVISKPEALSDDDNEDYDDDDGREKIRENGISDSSDHKESSRRKGSDSADNYNKK